MSGFVSSSRKVSDRMRRIGSKNTNIERSTEGIIKSMGLKYIKQPQIFGKPDFRIAGTKILIFCDSSFWHGRRHEDVSGASFGRNKMLWVKKLRDTRKRDRRTNKALKTDGWIVLRFWDDEILKRPQIVINKIVDGLDGRE